MTGALEPGGWQEWRSHWYVIIPCFFGMMLCSAHGAVLGVTIIPIENEYGWARAEISAGFLIIAFIALFVSPFAGRAVDRLGARRIALTGVVLYCTAFGLLSTATPDVITWWALWGLLALAMMTVMPAVWLSVITGYFVKCRGLAMAIALSATGMTMAVLPLIADLLVEAQGWRGAYVSLSIISFCVVFPLALFLFRPAPQAESQRRSAARQSGPAAPAPVMQARSVRFVKLATAAVIFAVASSALTTNAVPLLVGEGLSPRAAAASVGLIGIGSITGRLFGGYLLDRFNGNYVAAGCTLMPIVPAVIFLLTEESQAWAVVACLIIGLSIGTEVDCCAFLTARHFGTLNFGALFGTINGMLLFGNGLAPIIANYGYDVTRSYDIVLVALIPVFLATSVLFATLGKYPELDELPGHASPETA